VATSKLISVQSRKVVRVGLLSLFLALFSVLSVTAAIAETSDSFSNPALTARLISVENGVAPNTSTLSLGLDIQLGEGWKAYWRSPGEVGFPPKITWDGSENLSDTEIFWPAPKRFTAFGIENFGYAEHVVLPIQVILDQPGEPVALKARVSLLTCSDICVPHEFILALSIPNGTDIDTDAAALVAKFVDRVPLPSSSSDISITLASIVGDTLVVTAKSTKAFRSPDIFPEMGDRFTFGKPDIRTAESGTELWASLPLLARGETISPVTITITDKDRALTASPEWSATTPAPPFELTASLPAFTQVLTIALIAFLGGLILNVMPCVLPVLSIKVASVLSHSDKPTHVVRNGFLMSALGVLVFMWVLAAGILVLRSFGLNVGWGLQFQNPVFLAAMFMMLAVFAANLFGLFEISLPSNLQTKLSGTSARSGYVGDFATGAFAAILATPCSAPFLGTAIAFALAGRSMDVAIVFTALGLGLAFPYLLFALRPNWVTRLPKPGKWMVTIKMFLGFLMAVTALWLLWLLSSVGGLLVAGIVVALSIGFVVAASVPRFGTFGRITTLAGPASVALVVSGVFAQTSSSDRPSQNWAKFDRRDIPQLVSQGKTVFVDVTADWCLTCIANKTLVLDRAAVASRLQSEDVVAMQADWTRPDPDISRYLESHQRFGIPFNVVYGPNAPDGILLSEILTTDAVLTALDAAKARN